MFLMGIFWYHLYDMSNYKLCNLDTYNHNFGSSMGTNEFTTKILPLKNNLFRVVFRITGDVEQSEQIVQEALLKVWEDRDSWIVIENLPSYCMMVARNLALRETYSGNKERMERYAVR